MPKKMKAAVVHQFGQPLKIEEINVPEPKEGEVLVKIEATGVCHTDLHAAEGDWPVKPTPPFVPGHEGAGFVAAVGRGVKHVKEGDRVGIAWLHDACGHCEFCLTGWETLCHSQNMSGYTVNGSFAEYAIGAADYVGHIPAKLNFIEVGPILCAGVTTYKGLKETDARPGEWVVISGVGGLGHIAIQYAKAMGLHVVAVDLGPDKMKLAKSLGADITVDALTEDVAATVQKKIGGAHGVLVTAVSLPAFKQAIGTLRRKGTCVLCGLPPGDFPVSIFDLVLNGQTVRGSIVGTRKDLAEALAFAADGKVKATLQTEPLEAINSIFDRLKKGTVNGRIVLDFAKDAHYTGSQEHAKELVHH